MPKNTAQEIKDLGFSLAMFRQKDESEFTTYINSVLAEHAALLEGRIGSAAYASTASPQKDFVKLAEKYLVASEMMSRRITVICEAAVGSAEKPRTTDESTQRNDFTAKAEALILKVVEGGASSDGQGFACGSSISGHFGDT